MYGNLTLQHVIVHCRDSLRCGKSALRGNRAWLAQDLYQTTNHAHRLRPRGVGRADALDRILKDSG